MKTIIINASENSECSLSFGEEEVSWQDAVLMLCSTLSYLADHTINEVSVAFKKDNPDISDDEIKKAVTEDVADQLNFCFSNLLHKLCPKDPDLELSEVAIATCENIIIHYAKEHNLDIKEALKKAEEILSQYVYAAKPIGENGDSMACGKKKKGKGKGGC